MTPDQAQEWDRTAIDEDSDNELSAGEEGPAGDAAPEEEESCLMTRIARRRGRYTYEAGRRGDGQSCALLDACPPDIQAVVWRCVRGGLRFEAFAFCETREQAVVIAAALNSAEREAA